MLKPASRVERQGRIRRAGADGTVRKKEGKQRDRAYMRAVAASHCPEILLNFGIFVLAACVQIVCHPVPIDQASCCLVVGILFFICRIRQLSESNL